MKKMQCEVCGSTDIKKVDDTTFECQSCGIQYSQDEVKKLLVEISGKVKIDRSEELENNIKRGEQFEKSGNMKKAAEYYNMALDIDADNLEAQSKVKKAVELSELENYYFVKPAVNPQKNVEDFLRQLATTRNIVCDIYKEIKITQVTEKYYTFLFMKDKCECIWSAIACHKYYENETVWKEKYNPNTKKYYKEPVTQKVEKIQRVPQSGTYQYDCQKVVLASDEMYKEIMITNKRLLADLVRNFENLQNDKYSLYSVERIDFREVDKEDEKIFLGGMELDLTVNQKVYTKKREEMLAAADEQAVPHVVKQIGGDFYENLQAKRNVISQSVVRICIPVQIIEYTYKGQKYVAVSDLVSHITTSPAIYPCDIELTATKNDLKKQGEKSRKFPPLFWVGIISSICSSILLLVSIVIYGDGGNYAVAAITGSLLLAIGVVGVIGGCIQRNVRGKAFKTISENIQKNIYKPRQLALANSYEAFFRHYSEYTDISTAVSAASKESVEIDKTDMSFCPARNIKDFKVNPEEPKTVCDEQALEFANQLRNLEIERNVLIKKRIVAIVLMVVSCIVIIPLFLAGVIMIGNVNGKINELHNQIHATIEKWAWYAETNGDFSREKWVEESSDLGRTVKDEELVEKLKYVYGIK